MAPTGDEALPTRVLHNINSNRGDADTDADADIDADAPTSPATLEALNRRFPPAAPSTRWAPRRSQTDPRGMRPTRHSYDSPRHAAATRAHVAGVGFIPPGLPSTPSTEQNKLFGVADDPSTNSTEKHLGVSASEPVENKAKTSILSNVKALVSKSAAGKVNATARDGNGNGTWKDRVRANVALVHQKVIVEGILRRKPLQPSKDGRHVPLNPPDVGPEGLIDERSQRPYINNFIRSSRYTVYNFLPKQLLFQFSKLGNFYFLVMGILQMVPGLSTVGKYTTIVPLAIFVMFSMAKEGFDDYRRYQLDKSENRSKAWVLNHGMRKGWKPAPETKISKWLKGEKDTPGVEVAAVQDLETGPVPQSENESDWILMQWENIQVGEVVRIHRDQAVPADIVLLHATGPNGIAYIETMALDGETNLKSKQACPLLAESCSTTDSLKSAEAAIVSEDPNIDLYSYNGRVTVGGETLPLSLNNIVYRGSILRNTTAAIGIVVNSGEECKIRMNANKNATAKKPAMQSIINKMVLFQILIVLMLAAGLTIGYDLWQRRTENKSFYLVEENVYDASIKYKEVFFGYLIMFNTLIPLSLYISMEIIKIGQLILLHDVEMYDPVTDTPMVANTTTILENLGQVSYVFSDKTGTLTENLMRFRKLSVAGVACLHDMDIQRDEDARKKKTVTVEKIGKKGKHKGKQAELPSMPPPKLFHDDGESSTRDSLYERPAPPRLSSTGSFSRWKSSVRPHDEPEMKTEELLDYIRRKPNTTFSRKAKHFLLCIGLCHTCLPETKEDGEIDFQAASPDELALVEAARDLGYMLIDRPAQSIKLQMRDANDVLQTETYQVLDVIEFSSKRKRMTIILRMPDGRICVFCKGADNVIMPRLKLSHLAEKTAQDVNRRSSIRKTFEKDKAIRRMSTQINAKGTPRSSFALRRGETMDRLEGLRLSIGRRSTDLKRLSNSEGMATWLHRRQTEEMPSPRPSGDFLGPRHSLSRVPSFENVDGKINESVAANEAAVFENCFQHIDDFASEGLRTLLYGYRYIDEDTYTKWKAIYREAETSLDDRQLRIEEAGDLIEQKMELAGATAIEDKLQDGVPDTIDKLRRANIKVWMLTGDKRETAINIGHSARVCKSFSEIYILDATTGNLQDTITATLTDVSRGMVPHSVVVVDGQTLAIIDASSVLAKLFYDLVVRVDSVICCRASPSQKANLVKSIRKFVPKSMTLAIGDGANDIGMIQASHVGIGISGREGLQAARISDYSIAQFRFLQNLLFVHGRWNYLRTAKYVLGTFWKETLFFLVQAHFQRINGYSGTSLFESWSLTVFNSLFTSLPVILLGIFEKDLRADTLLALPELYTFGQLGQGFGFKQYFGWMFMGVSGSFIIFYFVYGVYSMALSTNDTSLYAMGVICFTIGVIFINVKLLILELHSKTAITFGGFIISILGWFLWNIILSKLYSQRLGIYQVRDAFLHNFGRQPIWWATLLLGLITLIVLELVVQGVRRVYFPTDQDLMQRIERDADARQILRSCVAAEKGELVGADIDGIEMQEVMNERGRGGLTIPRASRDGSRSPAATPRASTQEARRSVVRASHDDYRPPNFTPPAEEKENPFEMLKTKIMSRGD